MSDQTQDELKQEGIRRFKKLTLQFVVSKLTDERLESELNELNERKLLPDHFNLNELFTHAKLEGVHTTFLHLATEGSRTRIVQWLLENGSDPNVKNSKGETTLHIAVQHAKKKVGKEVLAALIAAGGRLDETNADGRTVSQLAEEAGVDLAKLTHKEEAAPVASTAADSASGDDSSGAAPAATESKSDAPAAGTGGSRSSASGADDAKNQIRRLRLGKIKLSTLAKTLLPATQPDCTTEQRENLEANVIQQLADPKMFELVWPALEQPILDGDRTLLHLAAESGCPLLTNALLKLGMDPNKQDSNGYTALHACTTSAVFDMSVAQILIADNRTNLNIKSYMKQETPIAAAEGKPYAAELQAIEVNKQFKMQVLKMLAQLNEKRRPVADCVKKLLELKNSQGSGASAPDSSATLARTSASSADPSASGPSSGAPASLLERLSRKTRRSDSLPYGRPSPSSEFGLLQTLGPNKNPKYGADYQPPEPSSGDSVQPKNSKSSRPRSLVTSMPSTATARHGARPSPQPGTPVFAPAKFPGGHQRGVSSFKGDAGSPAADSSPGAPSTPYAGKRASSPDSTAAAAAASGTAQGRALSFRERMALRQAAAAKGESTNLAAAARRKSAETTAMGGDSSHDTASGMAELDGKTAAGLSFSEARQKKIEELNQSANMMTTALFTTAGPSAKKLLTSGAAFQRAAALRATGGRAGSADSGARTKPPVAAGVPSSSAANSGEAISAVSIAMVREAYTALNPGATPVSNEIIRAAIQAKGVPNGKNLKELLEFVTLAAIRTESMRWDFGALDFHGSVAPASRSTMYSGFEAMWKSTSSSLPPIASPYSLGTVPANAIEFVTAQSSLDRSGAIYEANALRSAEAPLDAQYGYLGDETQKSVLWKQAVQAALAPEDISTELAGLGF